MFHTVSRVCRMFFVRDYPVTEQMHVRHKEEPESATSTDSVCGEGSSAFVYTLGPHHVVKVYKNGRVCLREVEILRHISGHDHLPTIVSCDVDRIVMTNAGACSLVEWLAVPVTQSACDLVAFDVASALQHMHTRNVVHLDVKADNIVIDNKNRATLVDFNLAHRYENASNEVSLHHRWGSSSYVAPEITRDYRPYSGYKSDVWSFGIVYTALCFKHLPFHHCYMDRCIFFRTFMLSVSSPYETLCAMHAVFRNRGDVTDAHTSVIDNCLQRNPRVRAHISDVIRLLPKGDRSF